MTLTKQRYLTLSDAVLKQRHVNKQFQFYKENISTKGDFIRFVCVRIAAALDQINKMADCRLCRLEGKQGRPIGCLLSIKEAILPSISKTTTHITMK